MPGLLNPPTNDLGGSPYVSNTDSRAGSQSYRGNYANLPQGITNAGSGNNNAYTRTVQDNELVSNQLNGLLADDSEYIRQARLSGMDVANDRGLLNSSIAAGASQRAAIQAGLPIATADAASYGTAAGQNLDALNSILANSQNNRTSRANAQDAAGAARYAADMNLRNSRENRQYEGEQAGINRNFQDYMTQMGFGNQMRAAGFQLGGQLLQQSSDFNHNLFLKAMDNPFLMSDPEALAGFSQFADQGYSDYYNDLFSYGLNDGNNLPQWQENSNWYVSPDFSQEYGDGSYVGGSPQLPYTQQPYYPYGGQ